MYLTDFQHGTQAKNNLEKEIKTYLETLDRILIEDVDFAKFQQLILEKVREFNKKHPRAKPKSPHYLSGTGKDVFLSGIECVVFKFLKVKITSLHLKK